jgi:hypothetical protein
MNSFHQWRNDRLLRRYAREDFESGEYDPMGAIAAVHGVCPEYDPLDVATQNVEVRVAETRLTVHTHQDDLHKTEDAMTEHVSPGRLRAGIGVAALAETVGMSLLLRDLNTPVPERYLLAPPLAMFMFIMLGLIVQLGTKRDEDGQMRRSWWVPVIYGTGVLLIVSLAVARMAALTTNDTFAWTDAAGSIVMLATVLGPSVVAEHLLTRLRAVAPLARKRKLLSRRLRVELASHTVATGSLEHGANERKAWRNVAARSERVYRRAFRNAGGTVPPIDQQPSITALPSLASNQNPVVPAFAFPPIEPADNLRPRAVSPITPFVKPNGKLPEVTQ